MEKYFNAPRQITCLGIETAGQAKRVVRIESAQQRLSATMGVDHSPETAAQPRLAACQAVPAA
eukprot:6176016-Pleurochrysis_carterae.AAC.1